MLFRAGVPRHAIIKKFAGEEISRLEELISVLSKLSRGARVPLEYISYMDRHRRKVYEMLPIIYFSQNGFDISYPFACPNFNLHLHFVPCHIN